MSLLSKRCLYGLRAALYVVANQKDRPYVSIRQISTDLDISFHFLTKILQDLTECGLMLSYRGPKGGVALARPARDVSLLDIVESLEGRDIFRSCILGLVGCGERKPCPLHEKWAARRLEMRELFSGASLADIGQQIHIEGLRLAD